MMSWTELERRFEELGGRLRFARLDHQSGTEGEYWRVAATMDTVARSRFESLAGMAGRKLREAVAEEAMGDLLRGSPDDRTIWYRFLATRPGFYMPHSVAYPVNDKGERGWVGGGHVADPAAVAAACCLELASSLPEDSKKESAPLNIHISGQNARLNVSSVDNSTNVVGDIGDHTTIFIGLRKAITEGVPAERRESILKKLDEMEDSVHTPAYLQRYREFMEVLADHVTVAAPFLAALASLLPS